jgi:hypothetical protein
MTNDDVRNQERLTRLLRAVSAEPDDRAWRLAIARLAAANEPPRWLAWALRPAALGTAALLLICTTSASWWWLSRGVERQSIGDQVMAAAGASNAPDVEVGDLDQASSAARRASASGGAVQDSGGLR